MARIEDYTGFPEKRVGFKCPGCGRLHVIPVEGPRAWGWNGDYSWPTFTPSILVRGAGVCHSFVTNGKIKFLDDCTHTLKGQTVELDEILEF